jgi:hypothetical protein
MKGLHTVGLVLGGLVVFNACYGQLAEPGYVNIIEAVRGAAIVDNTTTPPTISLPAAVNKIIQKDFLGYRLPNSNDYRLDWKDFYEVEKTPFVALNDFNSDGNDDIALLLVGAEKYKLWKLVVFHNIDIGYTPHILVASPADDGRDYGPIQRYRITAAAKCKNSRPCLRLYVYESAGFEYVWQNGRYQELNIGD